MGAKEPKLGLSTSSQPSSVAESRMALSSVTRPSYIRGKQTTNLVALKFRINYIAIFHRRIIPADSADEFYCIMGQLSQEMLEYKTEDTNRLIKVHLWRCG